MKILATAVALPSRRVTNEEIIAEISTRSQGFAGDLEHTLAFIKRSLRTTGTNTRYWTNGSDETSLSVTLDACRKAINQTDNGSKIDMLIYASVFGELTEPATSNLIAHKLGLNEVECLDTKEACDGWVKAMKVADALIQTGAYKRILVVNGEFSMTHNYAIMPDLFKLKSKDQLAWRFPIFTIGEAATAMIVERDADCPWLFTSSSRNDLYSLCTVTPAWHKIASFGEGRIAKDGAGLFTSWATELSEHGIPLGIATLKRSGIKPVDVDILFTHASSTRDWKIIASEIGLSNKLYDIHPITGNLVSASIPAAMALAFEKGELKRNDHVAVLSVSAGMTSSTVEFTY